MTVTNCDKCGGNITSARVLGTCPVSITLSNGSGFLVEVDVRGLKPGDTYPHRLDFCQSCYREIVTRALSDRIPAEIPETPV